MEKVFIFDLDGTLLDSKSGILFSLEYALKKNSPEYLPYLNQLIIGPPIKGILESFIEDPLLMPKLSKEFRAHYDSIGYLKTTLFKGVKEGLNQFQNCLLFVSTNKPKRVTDRILKNLKIDNLFNRVICIDSSSFKNKSEIVSNIIQKFNTENITVIGDSKDDYFSAIENNCNFVFCAYGYGDVEKNQPDFKTVYSASELFVYLSSN